MSQIALRKCVIVCLVASIPLSSLRRQGSIFVFTLGVDPRLRGDDKHTSWQKVPRLVTTIGCAEIYGILQTTI
jgi:hypothetical protein